MALIVGRRAILALQIVGIDGRIFERNLVVVGVVECLGQRVGGVELATFCEALPHADPERVVLGADGGFEIGDLIRALRVGVVRLSRPGGR